MASVHESELELELEPALHEAESEGEGARLTGQIDTFGDSLYSRGANSAGFEVRTLLTWDLGQLIRLCRGHPDDGDSPVPEYSTMNNPGNTRNLRPGRRSRLSDSDSPDGEGWTD